MSFYNYNLPYSSTLLYDTLRYPVSTEKSASFQDNRKYTFFVAKNANKNLIRQAVEKIYTVKVLEVNIINLAGKTKRTKYGTVRRANRKKAIVTLAKGYNIDFKSIGNELQNL